MTEDEEAHASILLRKIVSDALEQRLTPDAMLQLNKVQMQLTDIINASKLPNLFILMLLAMLLRQHASNAEKYLSEHVPPHIIYDLVADLARCLYNRPAPDKLAGTGDEHARDTNAPTWKH